MLIKSSTEDSLFQQALRRPKKVRRFLSHLEILKILGMGSLFPKKKSCMQVNYSKISHQLFGLKEAFQVLDLPGSHHQEDSSLRKSPPEHPLVGAFTGLPESLFAISLVVLFLGDLFHLVQELSHSKLKFRQFFLLCNVGIVDGVF